MGLLAKLVHINKINLILYFCKRGILAASLILLCHWRKVSEIIEAVNCGSCLWGWTALVKDYIGFLTGSKNLAAIVIKNFDNFERQAVKPILTWALVRLCSRNSCLGDLLLRCNETQFLIWYLPTVHCRPFLYCAPLHRPL